MDNIDRLLGRLQIQQICANSMHWVNVLHIENPYHFYVRLTKNWKFVQQIAKMTPTKKPATVSKDQYVIFNLKNNEDAPKYARGKITSVDPDINEQRDTTCDIFAIDYGNVKIDVPIEDVWEGPPELFTVPGLAINCRLSGCYKKGRNWNNGILVFRALARTDRSYRMVVESCTRNKLSVLLYNGYQEDFATVLGLTENTKLLPARNYVNPVQPTAERILHFRSIFAYKYKYIQIASTFRVRVLSGLTLGAFYVAELNDYKEYYNNSVHEITRYSKNQPKLEEGAAKKGTIIAVHQKSKNIYERGLIREMIDSTKALVLMVDTGEQECVHINDMRKMHYMCMDMPMVSLFCSSIEMNMNPYDYLHCGNQLNITLLGPGYGFDYPCVVEIEEMKKCKCSPRGS